LKIKRSKYCTICKKERKKKKNKVHKFWKGGREFNFLKLDELYYKGVCSTLHERYGKVF